MCYGFENLHADRPLIDFMHRDKNISKMVQIFDDISIFCQVRQNEDIIKNWAITKKIKCEI